MEQIASTKQPIEMIRQVKVSSEIAPLKKVLVHRPGKGIARIAPKRAEDLLFDDIVHLPTMQEEHDIFTAILKAFVGPDNVLDTVSLLEGALANDEENRSSLIDKVIAYEKLPKSYKHMLLNMPNDILAEVLISGHYAEDDFHFFDPVPNYIFTRDIAVAVNDHIIITKAAKEARFRENFLTRTIFWSHPMFSKLASEGRIINFNLVEDFPPSRTGEVISIEGGDMMMLNEDYLLVGSSERTTEYAIHALREELLRRGIVKNIVLIKIPSQRSFMHIDTIFTQINHKHIVAYKPIVMDGMASYVNVYGKDGVKRTYYSIKDFILAEIHSQMKFILTGNGESPFQEREQWTDGCNLLTVKPGVAITYDRNPRTDIAFKEAGYNVIHSRDLLKQFESGEITPDAVENTIILLPSNELSRARGGSHCMTCPIERG